jgi:Uma2 family endonuclease
MSQVLAESFPDWETAVQNMVTEDDEPVESKFIANLQRLLVESLYSSWLPEPFEDEPNEVRKFYADSNVGIFTSPYQPPLVPNMMLSLDTEIEDDFNKIENRSYRVWVHDPPPDVVLEIISDKRGGEYDEKMRRYRRMGVRYYVTFDPFQIYDAPFLRVYERAISWRYRLRDDLLLPEVGLSLRMWHGTFEKAEEDWLRWYDLDGNLILTGEERAEAEAKRAESLAAKLRELGVDPNTVE